MNYLHHHPEFSSLLNILAEETGIQAGLIEKDYWIMHVLYGLQKQGYTFELKGGTSLSKGFKIIDRFSEDIDLHIHPRPELDVDENKNHTKEHQVLSRKKFYDLLEKEIAIAGIASVKRDTAFDDTRYYRSGGIRLHYEGKMPAVEGIKEGILLEAGFDIVVPNEPCTISSWAYERAIQDLGKEIIDNTAKDVMCFLPEYTFVEKLQTIAKIFRQELEDGKERSNFLRQYYDVYSLLKQKRVLDFIGTEAYYKHKEQKFRGALSDIQLGKEEAFLLSKREERNKLKARYIKTKTLYYRGQPDFDEVLSVINEHMGRF